MKFILFLEQFSKISGGQKVLLNILAGLDRDKYLPYVGIPEKGELSDELEKLGVNYFILPLGSYSPGRKNILDIISYLFRSLFLIPRLVRIIRSYKINLIYANAPRTYLWATLAAKLTRIPIIWHLHSILSGWELKLCRVLLETSVTKMIAVSKSVVEPFLRENLSLANKVEVIYNGVNIDQFIVIRNGKKIRREFSIESGCHIIGFIGQIAKWKGIEDFIRAAALVLEKESNVVFLVFGDILFGREKEKKYQDYLNKLVDSLGVGEHVIFAGRRKDVPEILDAINVLVIPSIEPDPCPLILLEGMAAGKAVVASAHGGPAEIIEDGVDGKLFPPGDFSALAEIILSLLKDPEQARKLGETAQQKATENFSLPKQMQKIHDIISEVL